MSSLDLIDAYRELAGEYFGLAQRIRDGADKRKLLDRALFWYGRAIDAEAEVRRTDDRDPGPHN